MKQAIPRGGTEGARASGRYSVAVVQKALDVLEIVAFSPTTVTLQEIADGVGFPKPTVFRLLSNLEERGYVRRNDRHGYYLGSRSQLLSSASDRRPYLRESARVEMRRLRDRFGHTVSLGIRLADRVLYIDTIEGSNALRFVEPPGTIGPIHATALGKVLLAWSDAETCQKIASKLSYEPITINTMRSAAPLIDVMAQIKELGYALDDEESISGARCVAVPVFDGDRCPLAAMSISGPAGTFDGSAIAEMVAVLTECSRSITGQLEEDETMH